jgi:hypothetical protein
MAKAGNKLSTLRVKLPPENSGSIVIVVPTAADLTLSAEAPPTIRFRTRYRRQLVHEFLQRLEPSTRTLAPSALYDLFCKEFENDPVVKKYKLPLPSFSTFQRSVGKRR